MAVATAALQIRPGCDRDLATVLIRMAEQPLDRLMQDFEE